MNDNQPRDESSLLDKAVRQLKDMPTCDGLPSDVLDNVLAIPQTEAATTSTDAKVSTRGDQRTSRNSRRAIWFVVAGCLLVAVAAGWWIVQLGQREGQDVATGTLDKDHDKQQVRDDGKPRGYTEGDGYGNVGYESGRGAAKTLIVNVGDSALGNSDDAGAPLPFGREKWADDIALGVVGEPVERDGKKFVPLDLVEVYKGRLPTGQFVAEDQEVLRVECTVTERLGLRSELFKPKSHVGVYFLRDQKEGWTVSWIQGLTGSGEGWRKTTKLFCDVQLAPEAKDPAARYEQLLPIDKPLDSAACVALEYNPSPHAVPTLRKHWQRAVMSDPERTFAVAWLLALLHDAESVEPVLDCALKQENMAMRQMYFETLPRLCQNADEKTIRKAQRMLKNFQASLTPAKIKESKELELRSGYYGAEATHDALETLLTKRKNKNTQVAPTKSAK